MINFYFEGQEDFFKSTITATATIIVGLLASFTGILTIIVSYYSNKRNLNFLLEKDKREHESRQKKDELEFAKDTRDKQKAYNRILGAFLKVYHSYVKHKFLFDEKGVNNFPDQYLLQTLDKIDNFKIEISSFKKRFEEEAEIIPELTIYLHEILDILGRFELLDGQIPVDPNNPDAETAKLVFQRAHTYAVSELLDSYFEDLIEKIARKADVSEEFLKELKDINSKDSIEFNIRTQKEIMDRMFASLSRQTGQEINIDTLNQK
jgi:hypothetical protein